MQTQLIDGSNERFSVLCFDENILKTKTRKGEKQIKQTKKRKKKKRKYRFMEKEWSRFGTVRGTIEKFDADFETVPAAGNV